MVLLEFINIILTDSHSNDDVMHNILWVLPKVPSFILGMTLAKDCKEGKSISILWIITMTFFYVLSSFWGHQELSWLLMPLIIYSLLYLCQFIKNCDFFYSSITFMGAISLESYLLNISLNKIVSIFTGNIDSPILYGRYLEYCMVIIFGIILAYYVNRLSQLVHKQ